jgi:hypothetical protein
MSITADVRVGLVGVGVVAVHPVEQVRVGLVGTLHDVGIGLHQVDVVLLPFPALELADG